MKATTKEMVDLLRLLKKNEGKSSFAHEMNTTRGRFVDLLEEAYNRGFTNEVSAHKDKRIQNVTATFTDNIRLTEEGENFMLNNWEAL